MGLNTDLIAKIQQGLDQNLSIKAVARFAGVSNPTVYNYINQGKVSRQGKEPAPAAKAPPKPRLAPPLSPATNILSEHEFGQLLIEVRPRLENWATRVCGNRAMAEDFVSAGFINALKARQSFQAGTNFNGWIFRIVKNLILADALQRQRRKTDPMPGRAEDLYSTPETTTTSALAHEAILIIAAKLHWAQRDTMLAICVEGLGYDETAARYGVDVGTIKSRLWRGRKRMKELMEEKS